MRVTLLSLNGMFGGQGWWLLLLNYKIIILNRGLLKHFKGISLLFSCPEQLNM